MRAPASHTSFIASYAFDRRLAAHDAAASVAHAEMLGRRRIITRAESRRLVTGLKAIARDLARGRSLPPAEDVHYALERALYKKVGRVAGKLHTGR